jgi:ribonuclease J
MVNIISTAIDLGYINIPENTLISVDELKNYPDEKTVLITTGSQGESMAALSRMANGMHRKVQIKPNDTVIFSSHPIPGNEKSVSRVINELYAKGANVIFQDVHVSGHACQEEIKLIYSLVNPKYAIPVHGEYKHLMAQANVVKSLGYDNDSVFILSSGDVLEFDENENARVNGKVHTGVVMVDGLGVGDVGNIVLRDRQKLSEDGIIIVVITLDTEGRVLAGPDLVTRGFVYVRDSGDLMEAARAVLRDTMERMEEKHVTDWPKIKNEIKSDLSDFVWKETQRKPMILPIIMEV